MDICPLCQQRATCQPSGNYAHIVRCKTCGPFLVENHYTDTFLLRMHECDRGALSVVIRKATDDGEDVHLSVRTAGDLQGRFKKLSVSRRRSLILDYMAIHSEEAGHPVRMVHTELYPVFGCTTPRALEWLVASLVGTGELNIYGAPENHLILLTDVGWAAVERSGLSVSGTCFIAMAFGYAELDDALDAGIIPAVKACGLDPIRVDRVQHNHNINDEIISQLRKAEAVVADFSQHRNGVYFEAGYALGLGREVVFLCHESEFKPLEKVHFDTRPYNHILWETPADILQKLPPRLMNTVPSLRAKTGSASATLTP